MNELTNLIDACEKLHADLLMRADMDQDGTLAVNVSNSKWEQFNDALEQAKGASAEGSEVEPFGWIRPSVMSSDGWLFTANPERARQWEIVCDQTEAVYTHPPANTKPHVPLAVVSNLRMALDDLEQGFTICEACSHQTDFKDAPLDCVDWVKMAWQHLDIQPNTEHLQLPAKFDLIQHLHRQKQFSEKTFGPGSRTGGVLDHISKEIGEIRNNPGDVSEWIDVVLLALDGAWRTGSSPEEIAAALDAKQSKNESCQWPDWRQASPDKAIEHVRHNDHPLIGKIVRYGGGETALFRVTGTTVHKSGNGKESYQLYGDHILGGIQGAHESKVQMATQGDLAMWAEKNPQNGRGE